MKMRKSYKLLFVFLFLAIFFSAAASAQSGKLPPFRMVQANGKLYKAENLPYEKPILIIYFSPECDHCQVFMKAFFKRANDFKNASVVLITFLPVNKVAKFVKDYKTNRYPNMIAGTEGNTFFIRNYYKLSEIPFAALYDKNGNLVSSYQRDIPLNDLVGKLRRLK